jgi:hypothetical protein
MKFANTHALILLWVVVLLGCTTHEHEPRFQEYFDTHFDTPISEESFLELCAEQEIQLVPLGKNELLRVPAIFAADGTRIHAEFDRGYVATGSTLLADGQQPSYIILIDNSGTVREIVNRFTYQAP